MTDEYCYHSYIDDDCLPCHKSFIVGQKAHIDRLRQMLIDAGAVEKLVEHDAHWFGGNAQPLPARSTPTHPTVQVAPPVTRWEPPITIAEPVYNDQGFSAGFKVVHPEGVECSFSPTTKQCSCGRMDLGVVDD